MVWGWGGVTTQRERERERERVTKTQTDRLTDRQTDRPREREREHICILPARVFMCVVARARERAGAQLCAYTHEYVR